MSGSPTGGGRGAPSERTLTLRLEDFAWETIEQESAHLGVSVEDLIAFSVLYYLADIDSGRVARQITRSPYPSRPDPDAPL